MQIAVYILVFTIFILQLTTICVSGMGLSEVIQFYIHENFQLNHHPWKRSTDCLGISIRAVA